MKVKGRFELQEREDLADLSVNGYIYCDPNKRELGELWIDKIEIAPEDHDKFLKLVLTVFLNDEGHFDFIILEESENLPGLKIIWPDHLFEYFDVPKID